MRKREKFLWEILDNIKVHGIIGSKNVKPMEFFVLLTFLKSKD